MMLVTGPTTARLTELDLYSVYTLLFDTKQNVFCLSLDAKQKRALDDKLHQVALEPIIVPIAKWTVKAATSDVPVEGPNVPEEKKCSSCSTIKSADAFSSVVLNAFAGHSRLVDYSES